MKTRKSLIVLLCAVAFLFVLYFTMKFHLKKKAASSSSKFNDENLLKQHSPIDYCHNSLLKSVTGNESELAYNLDSRFRLTQVHGIMRHGDRSPSIHLENVWYECGMIDGDNKWSSLNDFKVTPNPSTANVRYLDTQLFRGFESQKCADFQLTFKGFRQLYNTGTFMREKYLNKFGKPLKASDVLLQCTNYRRTMHSAASFALGFLSKDQTTVPRSAVPIYTSTGAMLTTPPPGRATAYRRCKNYFKIKTEELQESGYVNRVYHVKPLFEKIATFMGIERDDLDLEDIFDNIWGMMCHDLPLPCINSGKVCLNKTLINMAAQAVDWSFSHKYPKGSSILTMQPFLYHSIISEIDIAIKSLSVAQDNTDNQNTARKFLFNFAHDSTLTSLLVTLGVKIDVWLPYASRIILEVWQDSLSPNPQYYIRLLLNGKSLMKEVTAQYSEGDTELNGQLLLYDAWRKKMVTGPYRSEVDYEEKCNKKF